MARQHVDKRDRLVTVHPGTNVRKLERRGTRAVLFEVERCVIGASRKTDPLRARVRTQWLRRVHDEYQFVERDARTVGPRAAVELNASATERARTLGGRDHHFNSRVTRCYHPWSRRIVSHVAGGEVALHARRECTPCVERMSLIIRSTRQAVDVCGGLQTACACRVDICIRPHGCQPDHRCRVNALEQFSIHSNVRSNLHRVTRSALEDRDCVGCVVHGCTRLV